ncbi:hypothetical protein [Nostoc sp. CCY 9925]|uniref:hypothetical protein n=1 Tax=Nostoc sp. CCY 9925 TaxID=3103865 RepID=UPI0039C606C3
MTPKKLQKLAASIIIKVIGLIIIDAVPSLAATVTYDFTTDIKSGYISVINSLSGISDEQKHLSGYLSYDDSELTGIGVEKIAITEGLVATLSHPLGEFFPISDEDVVIPPFITFDEGKLLGLTAAFITVNGLPGAFEAINIQNQSITDSFFVRLSPFDDTGGGLSGTVQYSLRGGTGEPTLIPESSTVLGICLFGLAGVFHYRQRH